MACKSDDWHDLVLWLTRNLKRIKDFTRVRGLSLESPLASANCEITYHLLRDCEAGCNTILEWLKVTHLPKVVDHVLVEHSRGGLFGEKSIPKA